MGTVGSRRHARHPTHSDTFSKLGDTLQSSGQKDHDFPNTGVTPLRESRDRHQLVSMAVTHPVSLKPSSPGMFVSAHSPV